MKIKKILSHVVAQTWDRVRPLAAQHRSREAWLAYCAKTGKSPDGVKK